MSDLHDTSDLTETEERLACELSESLQCEGRGHSEDAQGHAAGVPAERIVISQCPSCDRCDMVLLCAPRVEAITRSFVTMTCPICGATDGWPAFWRRIEVLV
jgi:hypothetical protein